MKSYKHHGPYTEEECSYEHDMKRIRDGKPKETWLSKKRIGEIKLKK